MVHLLQVSVVLTAIALIALGVLLYSQYYNSARDNVSEIIEIISNQSSGNGSSVVSGGGDVSESSGPQTTYLVKDNITLPSNVQVLQNIINDTRYTAILITENLTTSS